MFPLLMLLAAAGLLIGTTGSVKKTGSIGFKGIKMRPRPPQVRVPLALGRIRMRPKKSAPPLPTLQQLLAEAEAEQEKEFGELLSHKPPADSPPAGISAFLNAHKVNSDEVVRLYPEFAWFANHVPPDSHPETLFRAHYRLGDGAVQWWANRDGSWGYNHVYGGFDLWKFIGDLINDVSDAANWLEHHLSNVDWNEVADIIESVTSNIPILGTAVSDIVATVQVIAEELGGGTALDKAVKAAYDYALASIPDGASLHGILDPVVAGILQIADTHERVSKAVIEQIANQVPDSPNIEGVSPRSIAASLLVIVAHALGIQT